MDRILLIGAILSLVGSLGYTLFALGAGNFRPGRFNVVAILVAFALMSAFLYLRGKLEGSCPLNSLFDVLIFQSWSFLLIYLVVGTAYRLSLLGAFTAPLAFIMMVVALVGPLDQTPRARATNAWIETHAALSIVAYGALGLAAVAGIMYLLQERLLKAHKVSSLLYNLPPITDLAAAIVRLLWLGIVLLTISFAAGMLSQMAVNQVKYTASLAIWGLYALILVLHKFGFAPPRRLALFTVSGFVLVLVSLPGIQYLSSRP